MKILIIHNFYQESGGEDIVFKAEVNLLRQHGHEVVEFTRHNTDFNEMNPLMLAINTLWSKKTYMELSRLIQKEKPDIAHFHNTFFLISPAAYFVCKKAGLAVVQTLHNYRLFCPSATLFRKGRVCEDCFDKFIPWPGVLYGCYRGSRVRTFIVSSMLMLHRLLRTWHKQVDVYIALTEFSRKKFIEGGLPEEKIVSKPNFIYSDPGERINNGDYVLFLGRISTGKGIEVLLSAWKRIKDMPLKIVGDGPLMKEAQDFIKANRLEKVLLLGNQPHSEVNVWIKGARFLILPSEWYESCSMTITEAFACGVPVIVSRLGTMMEVVQDRKTGLHFEPGNSNDLAEKVKWAWANEKEMSEIGRNARKEYEEKYNADVNYKILMDIYRFAIERVKN